MNAIKKVLGFVVPAMLSMAVLPAQSAELAELGSTGFSEDGSYFAFEQYGTQDGSGYPYASITIVDVAKDAWVSGMPIAVRLENDSSTANAARSATQQQALGLLENYGIQSTNGVLLAHNPVSEISSDPKFVRFLPFKTTTAIGDPIEVTLNEFPLPAGDKCEIHGQTYGYRLLLSQPGKVRVLHEDTRIPRSRGCPLAYRIDQVIGYHVAGGNMVLAIMLVMNTPGFEGPDGKYLAVTTKIQR